LPAAGAVEPAGAAGVLVAGRATSGASWPPLGAAGAVEAGAAGVLAGAAGADGAAGVDGAAVPDCCAWAAFN
jgi:hypothetical protein